MTNEELFEEVMLKAHQEGIAEEVYGKMRALRKVDTYATSSDLAQKAFDTIYNKEN